MKKLILLAILVIGIQNISVAQVVKGVADDTITNNTAPEKSYPIAGSHLLREKAKKIRDYFLEHPEAKALVKPRSAEWNFAPDSTYDWWADSLIDGAGQYQVPSTCRAKGANCYVFVEDAIWNSRVDQAAVDAMVDAFDNTTPADAPNNDGIFNVDTRTFGTPPDVDSDPRIVILILDIRDDYDPVIGGGYVAGYFWEAHEYPDGDPYLGDIRSNYTEIFFMDCDPADLSSESGRQDVLGTTAHEFQHMIHWVHAEAAVFVNEGLSEIAEYICGYGIRYNGLYTQNTNVNLLSWDLTGDVLDDYSRAAFWTLYIYEQYPNSDILKDFVNNNSTDWGFIDNTLRSNIPTRDFWHFFEEWLIANYANGKSMDSRYQYQYSPLSKSEPVATYIGNPNGSGGNTLVPFGAEYIKFSSGDSLSIKFTGNSFTKIKALKIGSLNVEELNPGTTYNYYDFGTAYPEITFLVYNQTHSDTNSYSYIATGNAVGGTMELAYDDGVPDRPLNLTENDTITVQFNGIQGAILNSIKAGFLNAGEIIWGVNKFTGDYRTLTGPFGQVLVPSQTLNVTTSSAILDPFDNWITIDLSNQNIDVSDDFIIHFVVGSDNQIPGLMASAEADDGLRQLTFLQDQNPPDWFYLTSDINNVTGIWKYLVRAYVSVGGTTVLAQPTITSIIAEQGRVKLRWNTSSGPVEGYNIYRSTSTGFTPDSNNKIGNVGSTEVTYIDALPNIQANTDYYYRLSSFDGDGNESDYSDEVTTRTLDINDNDGIPLEYSLNSNYPNPFNPSTTFQFATPKDGIVKFTVHDLLGRVIYSESRDLFAGNYSFTWDGKNQLDQQVVSGVYFLRMETEGFVQTRKMLMMK